MTLRSSLESWLHHQWQTRGLFSYLLSPLSLITAQVIKHKQAQPSLVDFTHPPIIIVGNIIVGGAGKTPVVLALCDFLKQQGWQPGLISRGYGVNIKGPALVGQGQLDAKQFGDEPSLLAQQSGLPIAVHPKRVQALRALCRQHPTVNVIIADDGLQHHALPRDIEIIVQDARGVANQYLLPAGPLREPPERLTQADWLITQLAPGQSLPNTPTPANPARHVTMQLWPVQFEHLTSGRVMSADSWLKEHQTNTCSALAAIGQPTRFFTMLQAFGLHLAQKQALPDHVAIPDYYFGQLSEQLLLITAKDAVKCKHITDPRIWVVHVSPHFTPAHWLIDLQQKLQSLSLSS